MDKNILSRNLDSLKNFQPFLASYFDSLDFSEIECDGISFKEKGKKYLIHSLYSPEDEAKTLIEDIDLKKDNLIVLFGLGLGWHIFELKKNISGLSRVIIVEHNIEVLKYAFINIDFSGIFKDGQFFLLFGDEKQQADQLYYMMNYRFQNLSLNIKIIKQPNYHNYFQMNQKIISHLTKMFSMSIISHGNALDDMFVGFINNYLNIDAFVRANTI
ncbi:MAG: motility associated factor glycosyltransferase family protein, partial [Ruminiclostridium sp.]|nr:motility associated factor glycosyltransferase family protein [Ruminiclostridium sp.]